MKRLILLIGPTGTGKSTLERELNGRGVPSVISYTTRQPRAGEVDGVHYQFVDREWVHKAEQEMRVVQKVDFQGNLYGSTKDGIDKAFANSDLAVIVVEPTGLTQFQTYAEATGAFDVVSVYINNTLDTLTSRLIRRYTMDPNADPSYYWSRMVQLHEDYHAWANYTVNWNMIISGLDDTSPEALTVQEAAEKILVAFAR